MDDVHELTFGTDEGTLGRKRVHKILRRLGHCARPAFQTMLHMSFLGMRRAQVGQRNIAHRTSTVNISQKSPPSRTDWAYSARSLSCELDCALVGLGMLRRRWSMKMRSIEFVRDADNPLGTAAVTSS